MRRFSSMGLSICLTAVLCAALAGCGSDEAGRKEAPMPVEETVFGEQVRQIDKAKEQVRKMEGRMDDLNRQLEDASQ